MQRYPCRGMESTKASMLDTWGNLCGLGDLQTLTSFFSFWPIAIVVIEGEVYVQWMLKTTYLLLIAWSLWQLWLFCSSSSSSTSSFWEALDKKPWRHLPSSSETNIIHTLVISLTWRQWTLRLELLNFG